MEYQHGAHSVYDIKYHMIWVTKYRYQVLRGEMALTSEGTNTANMHES